MSGTEMYGVGRDVCSFRELLFVCRDICPILKDPKALAAVTDLFEEHVRRTYPQVQLIVGKSAYMRVWHVTRFKVAKLLITQVGGKRGIYIGSDHKSNKDN